MVSIPAAPFAGIPGTPGLYAAIDSTIPYGPPGRGSAGCPPSIASVAIAQAIQFTLPPGVPRHKLILRIDPASSLASDFAAPTPVFTTACASAAPRNPRLT